MAGYDDGVSLTDHEREVLAGLATALDDPWLAYQLAGAEAPSPRPSLVRIALPRWVAPLILVLGALLAFVTFSRWLWAGGVGLGLMALGGWVLWHDRESEHRRVTAP